MLCAIVLLTAAVGGYTYVSVSEELHESVHDELAATAELQAEEFRVWMDERAQVTRLVSGYAVLSTDDPAQISPFLAAQRGNLPDGVLAIHYVDTTTGAVVASSDGDGGETVAFDADTQYVQGSAEFSNADGVAITEVRNHGGVDRMSFVSPVPNAENRAVVTVSEMSHLRELFGVTYEGGFVQVVDREGVVEFDGRGASTHDAYAAPESRALVDGLDGGSGAYESAANGVLEESHVVAYAPVEEMVLAIHVPTASAYHLQQTVVRDLALLFLVLFAGLGGLAVVLKRSMLDPLEGLQSKLKDLRNGNLDVEIDRSRPDEFGSVLRSADDLRDDLRDQRRDADAYSDVMRDAADGDLTVRMSTDSNSADMRTISTSFNGMMDGLNATVGTVTRFADDVNTASQQVAEGATEVSVASEQVARSVEQISHGAGEQSEKLHGVSASMDDLSAAVQQISAAAEQLAANSEEATALGDDGRRAAEDALDGMETIRTETRATVEEIAQFDELTTEIEDIVEVIGDIAEQTNLLALNANIEAARAGAAGDGFAVVANEVKQLAEETAESATEVEGLVDDVQDQGESVAAGVERMRERVAEGTESVETAIEALEDVTDRVAENNVSVREVTDATTDQARSTDDVTGTMQEVSSVSEETTAEAETVSAAAEEQAASLDQVTASADALASNSGELREILDRFVVDRSETLDVGMDAAEAYEEGAAATRAGDVGGSVNPAPSDD